MESDRVHSKPGAGGLMSSQYESLQKRERLKKLAMETIDLSKDPYFFLNTQGRYECKLCSSVHRTEGNYLAHTMGRRHQTNLERRAAKEAENEAELKSNDPRVKRKLQYRSEHQNQILKLNNDLIAAEVGNLPKKIKIGRPGYRCFKRIINVDNENVMIQKCLEFEIFYPEIEANLQPRHRFMSCFEQKKEIPDTRYQYLLFAADPYETIAFKIPNQQIEKDQQYEKSFSTTWNKEEKVFRLQMKFKPESSMTITDT